MTHPTHLTYPTCLTRLPCLTYPPCLSARLPPSRFHLRAPRYGGQVALRRPRKESRSIDTMRGSRSIHHGDALC